MATLAIKVLRGKGSECLRLGSAVLVKCVKRRPDQPALDYSALPHHRRVGLSDYDRDCLASMAIA